MSPSVSDKLGIQQLCNDIVAKAHLLLRPDGIEAERIRTELYDKELGNILKKYAKGITIDEQDRSILSAVLSYVGDQDMKSFDTLESTSQIPKAIDFIHKLTDSDISWDRFPSFNKAHESAVLRQLAFELIPRCETLPQSLFVVVHLPKALLNPVHMGPLSDVYIGTLGPQKVAVKELRYYRIWERRDGIPQERIFREALLWKQFRHPNILPFIGIDVLSSNVPCMISPWMANGAISAYRNKLPDNASLVSQLNNWISQICDGLAYLHSHSYAHGDLRVGNILVSDDGQTAMIADFGLRLLVSPYRSQHQFDRDRTVHWYAPEILEDSLDCEQHILSGDVFSFAFACIEIYACKDTFDRKKMEEINHKIVKGKRPDRPTSPYMPDHLWSLVVRCWSPNPGDRPSISEVQELLHEIVKA